MSTNKKQSLPADTVMDGQIIGNYKIEKTIGQGTYGKVKLSHHIHSGIKVRRYFKNSIFFYSMR
jgi:hypothetical protein